MAKKKRVIAYHAHEYEAASVQEHVSDVLAQTDSYVVGEATDDAIEQMRSQGVLVEMMATVDDLEASHKSVAAAFELTDRAVEEPEPGHYLITFLIPLTEALRSTVEAEGVKLLRLIPPQSYVAYLNAAQVDAMRSLPQVVSVRHYDADNTAPALAAMPPMTRKLVVEDVKSFDVHPDRREDLRTLLDWLRDHQVDYERRGRSVRIVVPSDSKLPQQIEELPIAVTVLPVEPIFDLRLHTEDNREAVVTWLESRGAKVIGTSRRKIRVRLDNDDGTLYDAIRAHDDVESVDPFTPPFLDNDAARLLLGIDGHNSAAVVQNIAQTGAGEIVGVADTGVDDNHPDLKNRLQKVILRARPNGGDPNGHGTHVSGSIAGDGTASGGAIRGTAPGAKLVVQSLLDANNRLGGLPLDLNDLFDEAYREGVRIHNNSWGSIAAGDYAANSEELDEFVYDHPDMLILVAAGNEGTAATSANAQPGWVDLLSLRVPATAKNALTIGASRSDRTTGGYSTKQYGAVWPEDFPQPPISTASISGDQQSLAAFSSRGPSTDHRVKPELVAPGTDILSTRSSTAPATSFWGPYTNPAYAYMGGTSMATPLVSGCAAVVREYYRTKRQHDPSAALLKATLINGGRWLTGADAVADHPKMPNYHQGFGFLSMPDVLPQDPNPAFQLDFWDGWKDPQAKFDATGQQRQFRFTTASPGPIRVCLTWTDPPARSIQNILQVFLEDLDGPMPHRKWLGNEDRPKLLNMRDEENNVQVVRVDNAPAGRYMVQVSNKTLLKKPQAFALVIARQP